MKHYPYIFWDLDGTIINSYEGVTKALEKALASQGITIDRTDHSSMRKFIGPPLRVSFTQFAGLGAAQAEDAIRVYREYYNPVGVYECELFPDVPETLARVHRAGRKNLLASSKPEQMCRNILEKFHILDQFDEVVGATPDGRIDTKVQVLEEVFRRLRASDPGFRKEDCVLIGDTKYDADGAAEAGIGCIGVSYGFGTEEDLRAAGVLAVCDDLPELCGILGIEAERA